MPRAGTLPDDRAKAHYRWAQRYAAKGRLAQAIPHFGRALYYSRSAQSEFGGRNEKRRYDGDDDDSDVELHLSQLVIEGASRPENFDFDAMRSQLPAPKRRKPLVDAASTWSDVDVLPQQGEAIYTVMRDGTEARVNILGKILSLFHDVLHSVLTAEEHKYEDDTLDSIAYRIDEVLMYDRARRTITIDKSATSTVDLHMILKTRYQTIRVCNTSGSMSAIQTIELCSPVRRFTTQLAQSLDLIGAEGLPYSLYFCSQGFVYWSEMA
jgi:hypothetical protein